MTIEVVNETEVEVDLDALGAQARFVLDQLRIHPQAELCVVLVDEAAMTELHVTWMDEPGPTDVMSFPMDELVEESRRHDAPEMGPALLGDVVLCPEVAERQGAEAGHGTEAELQLLCTHGVLHLLGYDHEEPEEHAEMFGLQGELLGSWAASQDAPRG